MFCCVCYLFLFSLFFFFFFQAEDGIRDTSVTGVQTCALPIFDTKSRLQLPSLALYMRVPYAPNFIFNSRQHGVYEQTCKGRSEERRVGKECRYRWSADQ